MLLALYQLTSLWKFQQRRLTPLLRPLPRLSASNSFSFIDGFGVIEMERQMFTDSDERLCTRSNRSSTFIRSREKRHSQML